MAENNRSTQVVAFDMDQFNSITLELGGCMAQLRMVSTVAAHAMIDELPKDTLSMYLMNLEERFGALEDLIVKSHAVLKGAA